MRTCARTHTHVHTYTHTHTHTCIHTHTRKHTHAHIHTHTRTYTRKHKHTYTHTHTRTHARRHARARTHLIFLLLRFLIFYSQLGNVSRGEGIAQERQTALMSLRNKCTHFFLNVFLLTLTTRDTATYGENKGHYTS